MLADTFMYVKIYRTLIKRVASPGHSWWEISLCSKTVMFSCSFMHIVLHIFEISIWGANKLLKHNHLLHQQAATAAGSHFQVCWQQSKSPSEVRPCGHSEQQLARQAEMLQTSCNHEVVRSHLHSRWQLLSGWSRPNNDMLPPNLPEHR